MKNNRGQTLVIFVILLPILIIAFAAVVDISIMYMETNKINNINKFVINYGLDNLNDNSIDIKIKDLIKKNDKNITIDKIKFNKNQINLNITKNINSTFGRVIGIKKYKIVSNYKGILKENKKEIIKG